MARAERTALVTGSGQMIGKGIALRLAEAGFNIILNGSKNKTICEETAAEVEAYGVDTLIAMGNVGIKEEAEGIAKAGIDEFGGIDVLVNNSAKKNGSKFKTSISMLPFGCAGPACRAWSKRNGGVSSILPV